MAKKVKIKGIDQYLTAQDSHEITIESIEELLEKPELYDDYNEIQDNGAYASISCTSPEAKYRVRDALRNAFPRANDIDVGQYDVTIELTQKADDDHYEDESMYVDAFLDSLDNQNGWRKEKFFYDGGRGLVNDHLFDDGAPALKYFHREQNKIKIDMGHYEGIVYEMYDVKEGYYFDPALEAWIKVDLTENEDWENPSDEDEYYE